MSMLTAMLDPIRENIARLDRAPIRGTELGAAVDALEQACHQEQGITATVARLARALSAELSVEYPGDLSRLEALRPLARAAADAADDTGLIQATYAEVDRRAAELAAPEQTPDRHTPGAPSPVGEGAGDRSGPRPEVLSYTFEEAADVLQDAYEQQNLASLSNEELDALIEANPSAALSLALPVLTPEHLLRIYDMSPELMLVGAPHLLQPGERARIAVESGDDRLVNWALSEGLVTEQDIAEARSGAARVVTAETPGSLTPAAAGQRAISLAAGQPAAARQFSFQRAPSRF